MNHQDHCSICRVELKDVTVTSGRDVLLDHVSLELHCKELTALIGKNGAGKTTLLKAMLKERPYEGEIIFERVGENTSRPPVIGYVPQQLLFDKSTPVSVLDFMGAADRKRPVWTGHSKSYRKKVQQRLELFQCAHVIDRRLGDLSGGELQRVLLAMAIEPLPDLLILDEPVSGVDFRGLDMFYHMVSSLRDKHHMSILLVSHDLALIEKYADRAVLLNKKVLAEGTVEEVFATEAFSQTFGYRGGNA